MGNSDLNWIANYIWGIADDVLRDLRARANRQQLTADFQAYLDGFSPNVQDILDNFKFRNQIQPLSDADALGTLIEKLTAPDVNLSPAPVQNADGSVRHPGLDNHGMGSIFEELVRRFDEENNEEAGEHWTPRDAVTLMAKLVFLPIAEEIKSGTYLLYAGACGTGGMLTVAEDTLQQLAAEHGKNVATHLYGQEINPETYAICKADLLLKGDGEAADNIVGGPGHSTLANDAFLSREFDFMLSNPPYGKNWKSDLKRMGGKKDMRDPRFMIEHAGDPEYSLVTRSSDGQMLFLANKLSKMKQGTKLGSRIARGAQRQFALHRGRRAGREQHPPLDHRERLAGGHRRPPAQHVLQHRHRHLHLGAHQPQARASQGQGAVDRRHRMAPAPAQEPGQEELRTVEGGHHPHLRHLPRLRGDRAVEDLPNAAFGYWKVTVERPLRIDGADPNRAYKAAEIKALKESGTRSETAPPVIRNIHKRGTKADPLRGLFAATIDRKPAVVEYEPNTDLRDTEQIPLQEEGGIEAFLRREVLPYAADAWYQPDSVKIGYEISFTRYFYTPQPMRSLEEIRADILALEMETVGLLDEIIGGVEK